MDKPGALLLLGKEDGEDGGGELAMAVKSFFRNGEKGNYEKAAEALKEAIALCDQEDEPEEDDSSEDDEDSDDLML